jgi:hypothetical protein
MIVWCQKSVDQFFLVIERSSIHAKKNLDRYLTTYRPPYISTAFLERRTGEQTKQPPANYSTVPSNIFEIGRHLKSRLEKAQYGPTR